MWGNCYPSSEGKTAPLSKTGRRTRGKGLLVQRPRHFEVKLGSLNERFRADTQVAGF